VLSKFAVRSLLCVSENQTSKLRLNRWFIWYKHYSFCCRWRS